MDLVNWSGRALVRAALALCLTGCATIRSNPSSVFDASSLTKIARTTYSVENVSAEISKANRTPEQNRLYRNQAMLAYLNAIDARYFQFRSSLGTEVRGGALGFDIVAQGLAVAGSLSTGAAQELAAAAGFASGTRAAISKNLLFEKTLPALYSAMDSNRLKQRTLINDRMQKDFASYPMEAAWNDLQMYQVSGTFEDAVTQITDSTAPDRAAARAAYNRSLGLSCDATAAILPVKQRLGGMIKSAFDLAEDQTDREAAAKGRLRLENIAQAFDVRPTGTNEELRDAMLDEVELDFCEVDTLRRRIDRIIP